MADKINPIDALFDENNSDQIKLFNEKGEEIAFDQIAVIPKGKKIYAILKPVSPMEGLAEDEALVFQVADPTDVVGEYLTLVTDIDVIDQVFAVYDKLMDEEDKRRGSK